nr:hypothetical protein [Nonlabens ulvanivorans]
MGELQARIGRWGGEERISKLFTEYLGYPNYRENITFNCDKVEEHAKLRPNKSSTHGIDGLVNTKSVLESQVLEIGYISVKTTSKAYPANPRSKFKAHFIDLATGLECFDMTEHKEDIEQNSRDVKKTRTIGILFWLSNHKDAVESDVLVELGKSQLESLSLDFDMILVVDNARLQFIYHCVATMEIMTSNNFEFVYIETSLNVSGNKNIGYGRKFPLEYFANDIIPMRYKAPDGKVYLKIDNRFKFSEEALTQVISFAKTLDRINSSEKIIISFEDYNSLDHDDVIAKVKSFFDDQEFSSKVEITDREFDFRNI